MNTCKYNNSNHSTLLQQPAKKLQM